MYSKRIVISIIVIGCLVHFITCLNTTDGKKPNSKNPSNPPAKAAPQDPKKPAGKPSTSPAAAKPRGLPPNNNAGSKGNANSPTKSAGKPKKPEYKKPAAADKKNETPENTADDPDGEPAEEKPVSRFKRVFRKINNIRKKIYRPFRFFGRLIKKGFGSNNPKPTVDKEPET